MARMFYFLDIYPGRIYLQGKRRSETLPFLDDFGKILTVFNWTEGEPKSTVGTFYIRTASRFRRPWKLHMATGEDTSFASSCRRYFFLKSGSIKKIKEHFKQHLFFFCFLFFRKGRLTFVLYN